MSAAPPFSSPSLPAPPPWLMHEAQQRLVLLLNHVLQAEPEAMERLLRQKGRVVRLVYAPLSMALAVTQAGLLEVAGQECEPDLTMKVLDSQPVQLLHTLLRGEKPRMEIAGDVMLAAEVNWLVDHVRWDAEEDLSRIVGDIAARTLMQALRGMVAALKAFLAPRLASASNQQAHS